MDRDEEIIRLRKAGHTLQGIGEKFGLSRERIRQITYGAFPPDRKCGQPDCAALITTASHSGLCHYHAARKRQGLSPWPRDEPEHGEYRLYARGCRCAKCRRANTDRRSSERRARWAATKEMGLPDSIEHGSPNAYINWGCKCAECTQAHTQRCREYSRRRKTNGGPLLARTQAYRGQAEQ